MNTLQRSGWFTRIIVALATVVLVILGFFFVTVALAAGAVIAAVIGARLWWTLRKLKKMQPVDEVVEGEYRVVEQETTTVRLPPNT